MKIWISILQKQPPEVLCKKVFLKISQISQENICVVVSLKRLQHRCFPVKFAKFLKTPVLRNICERLLFILSSTEVTFQAYETYNCHSLGRPGNKANSNKIATRFIAGVNCSKKSK